MRNILVITNQPDPHLAYVEPHLHSSKFIVYDSALLINASELTYTMTSDMVQFEIMNDSRSVGDVSSIWFRKPLYLSRKLLLALNVPEDFHEYVIVNSRAAVTALYDLLADKLWVSSTRNIEVASNKLLQLQTAKSVGLHIPETIVTSSEEQVWKFREAHGDIVGKSVHLPIVPIGDKNHLFPTTLIKSGERHDFSGLTLTPSIFQELIPKVLDIRVVIVGTKVFACSITSKGDTVEVDFRAQKQTGGLIYSQYSIPRELESMLYEVLSRLGLRFGAFDLVLDKSGRYVFLEVNPNGQWGWMERLTGLPIGKAMAELLESC